MLMLLLLAVLLAAVIGANSSANCVGPAIGGGALNFRRGILLTIAFALLGLWLEGPKMLHSVGGGMVLQQTLSMNFVLLALGASLIATALATYLRFPVSTSQSLALAIVGIALFSGIALNGQYLRMLALSWVLTPIAAAAISILGYHLFNIFSSRSKNPLAVNKITMLLLLVTIAYSGYVIGANTGGFLISLLATAATGFQITLYPAIAFGFGLIFLSRGIIHTIGSKITQLGITTAMIAQLAAAITLHIFTEFGIPVSQSQAVVGGVVGVGLAYGTRAVNTRKTLHICLWWVITPIVSLGIAAAAMLLSQLL